MGSIKAAARSTANEIFEDVESSGRHDGLTQLQEINAAGVIVFALGVITQAIKLYAMAGIPWTQTCASLYLGSFFAIKFVMHLLKYYRSSPLSEMKNNRGTRCKLCECLRTLAFFITIACSSVAFVGTAFKPTAMTDLSFAGVLVSWAVTGFIAQFLFHRASEPGGYSALYSASLLYTILFGVMCAMPGKWATIRDLRTHPINLPQDWKKLPWNAFFLPLNTLWPLIWILLCATHSLGTRRAFRARPKIQHFASIAFMLLHCSAGILLYASE